MPLLPRRRPGRRVTVSRATIELSNMIVLLEQGSTSFRQAAWVGDPHTFVFVDQFQLFMEVIEVFISSH